MPKKIYDIFPPDKKEKDYKDKSSNKKRSNFIFLKKRTMKSKIILSVLAFFLVLFIIFSHTIFLKGEIVIWPETEKVDYLGELKVQSSILHLNYDDQEMPGEIFEMKEEKSRSFISSGQEIKEEKAQGTLTVYNNHSSLPQILIASTRFISSEGKLFRSVERVSVPGRTPSGPGKIDLVVVAAEAGEDYNIEKSQKFSIPGLQGTPMYTSIYAENNEPISGGYVKELPKITDKDVSEAREITIQDILNLSREKLKKEISEDFVIDNDLMEWEISEESVYPNVGENSESFDYSVKIDLKILSFKESDLKEMLSSFILNDYDNDTQSDSILSLKEVCLDSIDIFYEVKSLDSIKGEAIFRIDASALVYNGVREANTKKLLERRKIDEAETILNNYEGIFKAKINYYPFWLTRMPKADKIDIKIKVEADI